MIMALSGFASTGHALWNLDGAANEAAVSGLETGSHAEVLLM